MSQSIKSANKLSLEGLLRRTINLLVMDRIDSGDAIHAQDELNNYLVRCGVKFPSADELLDAHDDNESRAEQALDDWLLATYPEAEDSL